MPPGAIGSRQLQRGGPLAGYYQPVEIKAPDGAMIALAVDGQFEEPRKGLRKAGLLIGGVYRLQVSGIPLAEGREVFPTIEVIDRLFTPLGQENRFSIPVELSDADLKLALAGKFVTRVIYLEDPRDALPVREDPNHQNWFEAAPGQDPLAVADSLGRPVAILRLGGRLPDSGAGPDPQFFFGCPPFVDYPNPAAGRKAASRPSREINGKIRGKNGRRAGREESRQAPRENRSQTGNPRVIQVRVESPRQARGENSPPAAEFGNHPRHVRPIGQGGTATMKVPHPMIAKMFARRIPATLLGIALGMTILCSCRGPSGRTAGMKLGNDGEQAYIVVADRSLDEQPALDAAAGSSGSTGNSVGQADRGDQAEAGEAEASSDIAQTAYEGPMPPIPRDDCPPLGAPCMEQGTPLPYAAYPPWSPDAIRQPWPRDEYLRDGGDRHMPAGVGREWQVYGVEMEDAVAHYDTLDGRRIVEPSNEVYIYSPRFGAVRQVVGLMANEQKVAARGVTEDVALSKPAHTQLVGSTTKNIQLGDEIGARPTQAFVTRQGDGAISTAVGPRSFQNDYKPYENVAVIRTGKFEGAESLRLAKSAQAAVSWNETQMVQAIINLQGPMTAVQDEKLESVYNVKFEGKPALRLIKVASTAFANPGEEVWFTLRFDNLGSETIGNVTILDSLSTRLEYVPGSAQCSREAAFSTQPNEGDSSVIRCELKDPLEAGQGGVIRFCCRVR